MSAFTSSFLLPHRPTPVPLISCITAWRQERAAKARSDAIDRQLEEDSKKLTKEVKVLLLGLGDSGKSTIVRQMEIAHQNGLTDEELMTYRRTIYQNTLDNAQAIVLAMHEIGYECVDPDNRVNADRIIDYRIDNSPSFVFSAEVAQAIHQMWKDPIIPKLMDRSSEFYLMDNAAYFFDEVLRIGSQNYLPTDRDVLRARVNTTGVPKTKFTMGQHHEQRITRYLKGMKWTHYVECVTGIIFCAALDQYDQDHMAESLILFESVVNSRWFLRTSIILFLNKMDLFKIKLPKVPLERYFPDYSGGADVNKGAKYILWRFVQTNRARLAIYPYLTQATDLTPATDGTNIRLAFSAVKETIFQNSLRHSGIL